MVPNTSLLGTQHKGMVWGVLVGSIRAHSIWAIVPSRRRRFDSQAGRLVPRVSPHLSPPFLQPYYDYQLKKVTETYINAQGL